MRFSHTDTSSTTCVQQRLSPSRQAQSIASFDLVVFGIILVIQLLVACSPSFLLAVRPIITPEWVCFYKHAESAALIVPGRHRDIPPIKTGEKKQRVVDPPGPPVKRHRLTLPADSAHLEVTVLVSIVTEGEWEDTVGIRKWRTGEGMPQDTEAEAISGQWAKSKPDGLVENPAAHHDGGMRERCLGRLEAAAELGYEELRRRHVDDIGALFDRVGFSLGPLARGGSAAFAGNGGSSCVAGLPIRSRVSRSGAACVEQGEEGARGEELREVEEPGRTVVDDGLIELMYHYGR